MKPPASVVLFTLLSGFIGCGPTITTTKQQTATKAVAATPVERLPAATLARVRGVQGWIEVIEKDGKRQLLIDGVVHGAVRLPITQSSTRPLGISDPMVALIKAGTPAPSSKPSKTRRTALVVGLGTGQTATALQRAGFEVEAVELEPKVIELARRFFGYKGHAVAADGLAYLKKTSKTYNLVLLDAFTGKTTKAPPHLVSGAALKLASGRLQLGGVLAVRLLDSPKQPQVVALCHNLDRLAPTFLFGSGVGQEKQNLYVLSGAVRFPRIEGIAAWPVRIAGRFSHAALNEPLVPVLETKKTDDPTTREVTVIGYLVTHHRRDAKGVALALDLPHTEMGMMRYLLSGPRVQQLRRHEKVVRSPDEPTEAWRRTTAVDLLGGGDTCGSGQDLSPVIVALRGVARLRSNMPHYGPWARKVQPALSGRPWGTGAGMLYQLEVKQVLATFDKPSWKKLLRGKLRAPLRAAKKLSSAGKLTAAAKQLQRSLVLIRGGVPPVVAPHLRPYKQLETLARLMRQHEPPSSDALVRAVACDRTWSRAYAEQYGVGKTPYAQLRRALRRCALSAYRRVARTKHPKARLAAARLVYILDYAGAEGDRRAGHEIGRIRKRFAGQLPHLEQPPTDAQLR